MRPGYLKYIEYRSTVKKVGQGETTN